MAHIKLNWPHFTGWRLFSASSFLASETRLYKNLTLVRQVSDNWNDIPKRSEFFAPGVLFSEFLKGYVFF